MGRDLPISEEASLQGIYAELSQLNELLAAYMAYTARVAIDATKLTDPVAAVKIMREHATDLLAIAEPVLGDE